MDSLHSSWSRLLSLRNRLDRIKHVKGQFEMLVRFDDYFIPLWGLFQQATIGDIQVPREDYMDESEESWMWAWIKGNEKWNAWKKCQGRDKESVAKEFVDGVRILENQLDELVEEWRDDADPRVPEKPGEWMEETERKEKEAIRDNAIQARRVRYAALKEALLI